MGSGHNIMLICCEVIGHNVHWVSIESCQGIDVAETIELLSDEWSSGQLFAEGLALASHSC